MGVYIKNWSKADWKELLKWAKIGANNAMIGEFAEVEELPPHGRLIDADALEDMELETCDTDDGIRIIDRVAGRNRIRNIVNSAPTVIPAEEGEMKEKPIYEQLGYDPDPPFYAPTSRPIVTNYDRIISKTPEELARWIWAVQSEIKHEDLFSTDGWYIWLMQEAKEASDG